MTTDALMDIAQERIVAGISRDEIISEIMVFTDYETADSIVSATENHPITQAILKTRRAG